MTARRTISATGSPTADALRRSTEPVPSPGHLKYLQQRVDSAHTDLIVAKEQRLGATVIKRRERKWILAVAKLVAATPSPIGRRAA